MPPDWQSAVLDVLRVDFLLMMVVFWLAGMAGGAALGAAFRRRPTGAPD
ncbi:hypothetical protein [Catellatospora sichuanensis]|nr:hypothetical protein [Catellatospora sichuanensis]